MDERTDAIFDAFADMIADRVAGKLNLGAGQTLYSVEELAKRLGLSKSAVRQRIRAGEFGEVVHHSDNSYRVTAEGVWKYERDHMGPAYRPRETARPARRARRRDPGPI